MEAPLALLAWALVRSPPLPQRRGWSWPVLHNSSIPNRPSPQQPPEPDSALPEGQSSLQHLQRSWAWWGFTNRVCGEQLAGDWPTYLFTVDGEAINS